MIMVGQPEDSTLVARRLLSTSRWLCASPDYLAAHGTPTSVAELAGHRAVLLSTDSQRYWPLSGDSLPCQRVLSCNNITFAREAVVAGAGIAALPALICAESVHSGRLVRLLADVPLPVGELYAVYPSRRFQAMKVKALPRFPDQPPAGRHRSFTGAGGGPPDNIAPLNFRFNFRLARESP